VSQAVLGSVNVYLVKDNQLLLSRRQNTGWSDGLLCAPGGHTEPGETPRQAAVRELKEELALELTVDDLEFLCVAARQGDDRQYVAYEFVIRNQTLQPKNNEPRLCSELVWVDLNNLPGDIIPDFKTIIEQALLGGQQYLEINF
jgi:8-oxo-dGTP diphosphatase